MDDLICRGWGADYDRWVEGYYVHLTDQKGRESHRIYTGYAESDCVEYYPDWFEVDPSTVGRYAGLLDKSGNRIFEGDVCRNTKTGEMVSVKWHGTMAGFVWSKRKEKGHLYDFGELFRAHDKYEVIGNIHDNPELLEVNENE